jgi:hydroxyacylglutathione hydrolase
MKEGFPMKSARVMLLGLAVAVLLMSFAPTSTNAEPAKAPTIKQAPVPENVVPKASPNEPFVYRKVNDNLYVVAEVHQPYPKNEANNPIHTQSMGFVIGNKKAAIIDTGLGLADLRKFLEQFTDLPIIVLNTHGHIDHVGANQLFDMCYIAKEDEKSMLSANREGRVNSYPNMFMVGNAEMIEFAKKSMVPDKPYKYEFIKDGDKIDLGGVELEVVAFPGHSPGSVAYLDRRDGVAFTGDEILFRIGLSNRTNVATYLKSLNNFAERSKGIETIINGHQWPTMNRYDIEEERILATGILDGTIKGVPDPYLKSMMYFFGFKRISLGSEYVAPK